MESLKKLLRRMACQSNKSLEELEHSTPALLAGLIICQDVWTSIDRNFVYRSLRHMCEEHHSAIPPLTWQPEEQWSELLEWRHPRLDLNLLQLAVIFDRRECVEYLWTPSFTREEKYRDENSRLVNHPLHLACRLGHASALKAMGNLAEEILCEEGTVDLSQAKIRRSTSKEIGMEPNNVFSSEPGESLDGAGSLEASSDNELVALMTRHNSRVRKITCAMTPAVGTPISLIDKEHGICVPLLFLRPLMKLSLHLKKSQPSTVESLWRIVEELSRRGLTAYEFRVCMLNLHVHSWNTCVTVTFFMQTEEEASADRDSNGVHKNQVFHREVSILACQLLACVAEDTESFAASLKALWSNLATMAHVGEIELMKKAASYLPKKHLSSLISHLKENYDESSHCCQNSNLNQDMLSGVQGIEALAGEISLEHLCMLKILECVRGDARAARNLSALPEPLRERFHVPFQDLYDRLTVSQHDTCPDGNVTHVIQGECSVC